MVSVMNVSNKALSADDRTNLQQTNRFQSSLDLMVVLGISLMFTHPIYVYFASSIHFRGDITQQTE